MRDMAKQKGDDKATEAGDKPVKDIFSDVLPPKEPEPPALLEEKPEKSKKPTKEEQDTKVLTDGGWFERDGRWYCPPALSFRDESGQMVVPAKDSHYTKEEALELEGKRHRQPPLA